MTLPFADPESRVMAARSLRLSARNIEALLTGVLLPVMLMLLFVYVFGGSMDVGIDYVDYVVPGIVLLCAGFGAAGTALSVTGDLTNGIVDRFRTMPIRSTAVFAGHVTASVARNLVATTIVVLVGLGVGWRPNATPWEWVAAIALVVLFVIAISWLSAAFGAWAKTVEAANAITFVVMFLPYVSSAFVPADSLPWALRGFAEHQPVTPVTATLRGLWMGDPIGTNVWWAMAWCVAIAVVSHQLAGALFRRRTAS